MKLLGLNHYRKDGESLIKEYEDNTRQEIPSFVKGAGISFVHEQEFVKPYGKLKISSEFEPIEDFTEDEENIYFVSCGGYKQQFKKDEISNMKFYFLMNECWRCGKLTREEDKIIQEMYHPDIDINRTWYFCSDECRDLYIKEEGAIIQ